MSKANGRDPDPTGYEQRITAIREAIAIQIAVLDELAKDLLRDGHSAIAEDITEVVALLENEAEPVDRVDAVIPKMKDLGDRLRRMGFRYAVLALDGARRVLSNRRDRILCDTQPIDQDTADEIAKRDRKKK